MAAATMTGASTPSARALGLLRGAAGVAGMVAGIVALLGGLVVTGLAPSRAAAAAPAGPTASEAGGAARPGATEDDLEAAGRRARAIADLAARRFIAAAVGFEALIGTGGEPGDREQAAEARAGAGHMFHAIEHWRAILSQEPGPSASRRAAIDRRVAAARRRTTPLRVRVLAGSAADAVTLRGARVSLQRIDVADPRPAVEVAAEAGREVDLDPGVWSLIARAPGYGEVQRVLTIGPAGTRAPEITTVDLPLPVAQVPVVLALGPAEALAAGATWTLTPEGPEGAREPRIVAARARQELSLGTGRWRARAEAPGFVAQEQTWSAGEAVPAVVLLPMQAAPPVVPSAPVRAPAPDARLGLGLGVGLGAATSLGLGVGLLLQHRERYAHFEAAPNNAGFVTSLTASNAGAGLVGAGAGLATVALTTAGLRGWVVGNRGLWAELAVGGGVALLGSAWYAREWQRVQKDLYDGNRLTGDPDMDGVPIGHDVKSQRRETAAAAVIGAGAGLMIGAGAALLTRTLLRLRAQRGARGSTSLSFTSSSSTTSSSTWTRRDLRGGPLLGPGQVGFGLRGRF